MVAIALFRSWCFSTVSFFLRQHWSHLVLPHHYFFILSPYLLQPRYPVFSPLLHCRTISSLRKQPTFGDATTGFPAKWRLRNERRNSTLMTRHHPDLGSASDWSRRVGNLIQPIRSTTQIWVVTRHQYGISALVSRTSFGGETSGSVAKCRLFSQAGISYRLQKIVFSHIQWSWICLQNLTIWGLMKSNCPKKLIHEKHN